MLSYILTDLFSPTSLIGHFYNVIYIIGFLIKNIVWLRFVMIIGAILEIIYFVMVGDEELGVIIFYCTIWIIVNAYELYILLRDNLRLKFNERELLLYNLSFNILSKLNYRKLLDIAELTQVDTNTTLLEENVKADKLYFISKGVAVVEMHGNATAYLSDGNFIGEMSYISNELTTAKVTTITPVEFYVWHIEKLKHLMHKHKEIEEGLNTIFNHDLVRKLSKMRVKRLNLNEDFS